MPTEKGRECGTGSSAGPKAGLGRLQDIERKRGLDGRTLLVRLLIGAQDMKMKIS
jgi:hypothetical protein